MIGKLVERACEILFFSILAFIPIMGVFMLFVYMPVSVYTEGQCLEAGYPKSAVAWNLKRYCMNLEGTLTVRVEKMEARLERAWENAPDEFGYVIVCRENPHYRKK